MNMRKVNAPSQPQAATYAVLEESGMRNECDAASGFSSLSEAIDWMEDVYDADEIDDMSIRIAKDTPEGRT